MLEIFKGFALTAVVMTVSIWSLMQLHLGLALFIVLPVIVFLLPVVAPNRRWVWGYAAFFAPVCFLAFHSDFDSPGGALMAGLLSWVFVASVAGILVSAPVRALVKHNMRSIQSVEPSSSEATAELPPISRSSILWTASAIGCGLLSYSIFVMLSAISSAKELAGDRSYCIQVETMSSEYRPLRGWIDLTGFYMMSNGSINHSILVVGKATTPELHHWSYWGNRFEPGALGIPPIVCDPARDFLHERQRRSEGSAGVSRFYYHGLTFSIPQDFAPRAFSTSSTLAIAAAAPLFTPGHLYAHQPVPGNYIEITIGADPRVQSWRRKDGPDYRVEPLGEYAGLIKERVWSRGSTSPQIQYYQLDDEGNVRTWIQCFEDSQFQCTHLFQQGRFAYFFHHMPADLGDWRGMQRRLASTVEGFIRDR